MYLTLRHTIYFRRSTSDLNAPFGAQRQIHVEFPCICRGRLKASPSPVANPKMCPIFCCSSQQGCSTMKVDETTYATKACFGGDTASPCSVLGPVPAQNLAANPARDLLPPFSGPPLKSRQNAPTLCPHPIAFVIDVVSEYWNFLKSHIFIKILAIKFLINMHLRCLFCSIFSRVQIHVRFQSPCSRTQKIIIAKAMFFCWNFCNFHGPILFLKIFKFL